VKKVFDPGKLRSLRKEQGVALKEVAARMDMSVAQIQRLETGHRRLNIDTMIQYCDVLGVDVVELLRERPMVPIIGVLNNDSEVLPLKANTKHEARAPYIVPDPHRLSAIRWEAKGQFSAINGHIMFFYADLSGIPERSWGHRNIIRRANGTHRAGWLVKEDGKIHIDDTHGELELDVDVDWASPILAVVPPFLVE
jgi:transcriptional regulator with XRE-family HTH domain